MKAAVKGTPGNGPALELLVRQGDLYRTVRIDYHEGLRYPHLERIDGTASRLDDILAVMTCSSQRSDGTNDKVRITNKV
jgi:hypothetical protein